MKISISFIIMFCLCIFTAVAQDENIINGDIIVKFQDKITAESFCRDFETNHNVEVRLEANICLSQAANIWLLKYDHKDLNQLDILNQVKNHNDILIAQFNHNNISSRVTVPDDTQYGSEWGLDNTGQTGGTADADIDAPEAWDISTGGTTTQGDEIVVAVIDGGIDLNHEDLVDNLWKNTAEIPGNGIDDDGNGYIDDYDGWNAYGNNGTLPGDNHGTHVCGTVGATGNNNLGVTGVNWNVKVMPIAGSSNVESTVIAAYGYVLDARTLYNTSGGTDGAFVVSTNASFGVDFGDPANFPLWCGIYDDLGVQGVLNAGATANQNTDVDAQGDVPTACASPYMISVTNTTHTDNKNAGAAYGLTTIDLGAPGTSVLSTLPGNSYGNNTGTSMATPHVAGAVALMIAAACDDFITNYKNDPGMYILELKDAIMNGTDPISDLNGTTVSGGRLNVYNAILELNPGTDGECNPGFALSSTATAIEVCTPANAVYTIDVQSLVGFTDPVTLSVTGNPAGTTISFSTNPVTPGTSTDFTISNTGAAIDGLYTMTMSGIATGAPSQDLNLDLNILSASPTPPNLLTPADAAIGVPIATSFTWNPVTDASSYDVEIATDISFNNIINSGNSITNSYTPSSNLNVNTSYFWRVSSSNDCGVSGLSSVFSFETQSAVYCDSNGNDTSDEWIESIDIAGVENVTGTDGGYADYTSIVIPMDIGTAYPFTLTPGWTGTLYNEYWKVWIDYNGDGTFSEIDEVAYDAGSANQNIQTGNITIPASVTPGLVMMRITMKYDEEPEPCESFTFGEVEDYFVDIKNPVACDSDLVETGTYAAGTNLILESTTYIQSDAIVAANANVTYDASDEIELLNGFSVNVGGDFSALIEGCGGTTTIQNEEDESK